VARNGGATSAGVVGLEGVIRSAIGPHVRERVDDVLRYPPLLRQRDAIGVAVDS
jgi:hypothetical protein